MLLINIVQKKSKVFVDFFQVNLLENRDRNFESPHHSTKIHTFTDLKVNLLVN